MLLAEVWVQILTGAAGCKPLSASYQLRTLHWSDIICALCGLRANKLNPFFLSLILTSPDMSLAEDRESLSLVGEDDAPLEAGDCGIESLVAAHVVSVGMTTQRTLQVLRET